MKKNNGIYEVEIIIESDDYDFIKEKEIEFIKLYGRKNNKTGILANLTDGGEGVKNRVVTKECRLKMSNSQLNRTDNRKIGEFKQSKEAKKLISSFRIGKKLSQSSIQKRTQTRKDRNYSHSLETIEKMRKKGKTVLKMDIHEKIVEKYISCHDVERKTGIAFQRVSKVCRNRKLLEGFMWKYKI